MEIMYNKVQWWVNLFLSFYLFTFLPLQSWGQGVMDVHSHIITPEFLSALESEGRLMDEGFPLPKYDVTSQLKWMDEAGVQTSVLTLAATRDHDSKIS